MITMKVQLILAMSLLVVVGMTEGRERYKLDFGWKFEGSPNLPCENNFNLNMSNQQCLGLGQNAANTSAACAQACCINPNCQIWQWCEPNTDCGPAYSCWIGALDQCQENKGWVSMARSSPINATVCNFPLCEVAFNDTTWESINVPHDFVIEGTFTPTAEESHGYLPHGVGWYRLHFALPSGSSGQRIWIEFDGVYRNSQVWINGYYVGNHPSGYTSFMYDITNFKLNYEGENVLVVFADATIDEGWWYEGGGIYRHVWLNVADFLHIAPYGVFAPALITGTITNSGKGQVASAATVGIEVVVNNSDSVTRTFSVVSTIYNSNGVSIGKASSATNSLSAGEGVTILQDIALTKVMLWSPESPTLFTLNTAIIDESVTEVVDSVTTTIGVRKVYFDYNTGFYLNDQPVKILGVCNHQDFAGVGTAVPDRINKFRVQKLLEMGFNGWRMSHNPPNPELLDFTDELGVLVWDENRNFANVTQYFEDLASMVLRDRNHPSVIVWSLCNEAGCMEDQPTGAVVGEMFKSIVRKLDPTRPVTAAMNGDWGVGLSDILDVQGINYNYGEYPTYHASHPAEPLIASETASCTCARGIYITNATACHSSVQSADNCAEGWWNANIDAPYIAGGYAWTGFDYKGEPTPYSWPDVNSNFGIIDLAGFPKDTFYYYQSWWTDETVLHIFPHWNWGNTSGQKFTVYAYSNAASVELLINGQSQGKVNITTYSHAYWNVVYIPGSLTAIAYNGNGAVIGNTTTTTTGEPANINLEVEVGNTGISADGQDVALIKASVVDSQGRIVPTASNYISFSVQGPGSILGVGNGDPSCLEPDKAQGRSAFGGLARCIIQSEQQQPGTITLLATSPGLGSAKITVTTS